MEARKTRAAATMSSDDDVCLLEGKGDILEGKRKEGFDLDEKIEEMKLTLARTEAHLEYLVTRRDQERAALEKMISRRERADHAAKQAASASGFAGVAGLSASTAAALRQESGAGSDAVDVWAANFDWDERVQGALEGTFGLSRFRAYQREVINATIAGKDCFVVLRTGGGKSLTYQLPAVLQGGISLVISPLLSLIKDQVDSMNLRLPGSAAALTSATERSEAAAIYRSFKRSAGSKSSSSSSSGSGSDGRLRLVYVTPERVSKSKQLMAALEAADQWGGLTRFVVDEAHCCSQWGHDFRSDYGQLFRLKKAFPRVPLLAVTATAPPALASDVTRILLLDQRSTVHFRAPSDRPNLFYEVVQRPSKDANAAEAMFNWILRHGFGPSPTPSSSTTSFTYESSTSSTQGRPSSGIIYCYSRKEADTLAVVLCQRFGLSAGAYHAGLDDDERARVHSAWLRGEVSVVCATVAFGLGIDKPDGEPSNKLL